MIITFYDLDENQYPETFDGTFEEAQAYARKVVRGANALVSAIIFIDEEEV